MQNEVTTGDQLELPECFRAPIEVKFVKHPIIYVDRRGNKFEDPNLMAASDAKFAREDYYNYRMQKRNWIEKLFNIKPDMNYYDKLTVKY